MLYKVSFNRTHLTREIIIGVVDREPVLLIFLLICFFVKLSFIEKTVQGIKKMVL